jgi:hypothetical protein
MTWPKWPVGMGERPKALHPGKRSGCNHKLFNLTLNRHFFEFALILKVQNVVFELLFWYLANGFAFILPKTDFKRTGITG